MCVHSIHVVLIRFDSVNWLFLKRTHMCLSLFFDEFDIMESSAHLTQNARFAASVVTFGALLMWAVVESESHIYIYIYIYREREREHSSKTD